GSRLARGPLAGPRDGPSRAGRCCPSTGQGYEAPPPRKSGTAQLQRAAWPTHGALILRGSAEAGRVAGPAHRGAGPWTAERTSAGQRLPGRATLATECRHGAGWLPPVAPTGWLTAI